MFRNDGIGGTPRLARYTSIRSTPGTIDAPPNRSRQARRTPGEPENGWDARLQQAREGIAAHLPSRLGECRHCDVAAPCRPFLRALAILDRWDAPKARRIRAVLHLSGLMPPKPPADQDGDDTDT
ncbi:hypothetical protein ACN27F_17715 [Solwaraspora sp. WMMB335]|uniref:hypothetical protein n=1 Tax=Solwaraspora sp. WMMB335 TaxID=3404118 RepID=UPI003B964E8D